MMDSRGKRAKRTLPSDEPKDSGAETHVRPNHSFFFNPVQYWSAIVLAFGIYMAVA